MVFRAIPAADSNIPPTTPTPDYIPIQTDATTPPPVSDTPIPANLIPPQTVPTVINAPVVILPQPPAKPATGTGTAAPQVPSVNDPIITAQIAPQYVPPITISPVTVSPVVSQYIPPVTVPSTTIQPQPDAATVAAEQAALAIAALPPPIQPIVTPTIPPIVVPTTPTPTQPENSPPAVLPDAIYTGYTVNATIFVLPSNRNELFVVNLQNNPSIPKLPVSLVLANQTINLLPIPIALEDAIMVNFKRLALGNITNFFDDDRVLKTLMNFGTDYQALMTNWKPDVTDTTGQGIVAKLYKPLPPEVTEKTSVFISRELAYPILDKVFVIEAPAAAPNVYLRHPNKRIKITGAYGSSVNNVTQNTLFSSGAFDIVQPQDSVMQEWFTTNLEGAELNIDYSNFRNFVFFGSAQKRLDAFQNKLKLLEDFEAAILFNSASMSITGSAVFTGSLVYNSLSSIAQQRQDIIRSFDGYERFLYYGSGSAFSGSFVPDLYRDVDDPFYFYPDATWPKISGSVVPIASASAWFDGISIIAQAYDEWNVNRFVNNLPTYLQDDPDSIDYIHFFDLTGHMFDVVKSYVDHMSDIYDRGSNPEVGLSQDMVWDIANAFGINLPNQYSLQTLFNYTLGRTSDKIYRKLTTETWRRFLHNQIFLMKTKGTKTALQALLNTYGILPSTIQIRESSAPSSFFESQSFENYEEQTQALAFNSGAFLTIPWSSSVYTPITLETRFSTTLAGTPQTLMNAGNTWSVVLTPGSGSNYQVTVYAASTPIMSSSFWPMSSGNYFDLMLQYTTISVSMSLAQADNDGTIIINDTAQDGATLPGIWETPQTLYLGSSGSAHGVFVGNIDEFRIWGELTRRDIFEDWVQYPGLYNGNDTNSAATELWVRLSFNRPSNLGSGSQLLSNEAPLEKLGLLPSGLTNFSASGFTSIALYPYNEVVYSRNVLRYTPVGGGTQFDSNKILIADPPVLQYFSGSAIPVLHRNSSIVSITDKQEKNTIANNVVGFYFSATEAINDSIIRSIGNIDINNLIGDPGYLASGSYHALDVLNEFYWKYYAYNVNTNNFIQFIENLMGPLFEQAHDLVPARAKLMSGVVIEPHILERYKTSWNPVIKDSSDLPDAPALSYQPDAVTADYDAHEAVFDMHEQIALDAVIEDHEAVFDLMETLIPAVDFEDYNTAIPLTDYQIPFADLENYDGIIDTGVTNIITADVENLEVTIDINDLREKTTADVEAQPILVSPYTPTYGSLNNLATDPGATEYFSNLQGLFGKLVYGYVQLRGATMTDKGTWTPGTMYNKDDMVLQPSTITDTRYTNGNNREFFAINGGFISNIPPYGDTSHWRPVAYTPVTSIEVLKAVLISGSLSLVPTGSSIPPVQGYLPQHYRFFRPNYTAYTRARYTGCVQTDQTTIDGKPTVEILASAADRLIVVSSPEPIQTPTPTGGASILNVV